MSATPGTTDLDRKLMAAIAATYGAAIRHATVGTPISEAFVAALVANETGLDASAVRVEHGTLGELAAVAAGLNSAFGAITRSALLEFCQAEGTPSFQKMMARLRSLATSYGPTQIMGYQALAAHYPLSELQPPNIETHFVHAVGQLSWFISRWKLDPSATDAADLFRCWNTGSPTGKTYDPNYAARGLARMHLYAQELGAQALLK